MCHKIRAPTPRKGFQGSPIDSMVFTSGLTSRDFSIFIPSCKAMSATGQASKSANAKSL